MEILFEYLTRYLTSGRSEFNYIDIYWEDEDDLIHVSKRERAFILSNALFQRIIYWPPFWIQVYGAQ